MTKLERPRPQSQDDALPEDVDELPAELLDPVDNATMATGPDDAAATIAEHTGKTKPYKPVGDREFGRFELLIEMGRGGMATLFLARLKGPQRFQKYLAIKRIHEHLSDEQGFVDMFLDEARLAALIQHPNVVTVFDFGELQGSYFMSMEYVAGQNLTDILRATGRSPGVFHWSHAVRIVADAAKGLHAAHELTNADGKPLGVVHRDVSPQNILVSYDGHVKVVDFGIAYAAERIATTVTGVLKGKAAYMSPEQTESKPLDRRSDIFALGTVLYESVCLRRLFKRGNDAATLLAVREAKVPPLRQSNPELPTALERIVNRALAVRPEDRYATAEELAEELDKLLVAEERLVTRQKVASFMDAMFFDLKRIKEEQIQHASRHEADEPVKGLGMASETSVSMMQNQVVAAPARTGRILVALASVALVIALATLAVVYLRRPAAKRSDGSKAGPQAMERPEPDTRSATPPRPLPGDVTLTFQVTPREAPVRIDYRNATYRGTTVKIPIPRGSQPVQVTVRAAGYESRNLAVTPDTSREIPVALVKTHSAAMRRAPPWRRTYRYRPMRRGMRRPMLKDLNWE